MHGWKAFGGDIVAYVGAGEEGGGGAEHLVATTEITQFYMKRDARLYGVLLGTKLLLAFVSARDMYVNAIRI